MSNWNNWNNVNISRYSCCKIIIELQTMYFLFHNKINYISNKNQHVNKDDQKSIAFSKHSAYLDIWLCLLTQMWHLMEHCDYGTDYGRRHVGKAWCVIKHNSVCWFSCLPSQLLFTWLSRTARTLLCGKSWFTSWGIFFLICWF